jgi:hypothetical protein
VHSAFITVIGSCTLKIQIQIHVHVRISQDKQRSHHCAIQLALCPLSSWIDFMRHYLTDLFGFFQQNTQRADDIHFTRGQFYSFASFPQITTISFHQTLDYMVRIKYNNLLCGSLSHFISHSNRRLSTFGEPTCFIRGFFSRTLNIDWTNELWTGSWNLRCCLVAQWAT